MSMRGRCALLISCLGGCSALRFSSEEPPCWSVPFGSTPYLSGIQSLKTNVTPKPFEHFYQSTGMQGLFVYPAKRFAMCTMAKNSCSSWNTLFNKLVHNDMGIARPNYQLREEFWSERSAREVFQDPQSVRALWVRDPLERFLSGFLDKCMTATGGNYMVNCAFRNRETNQTSGFPLSQAEQWFMDGNSLWDNVNEHFLPQSKFCELKERLHEYNVIGLMRSADYSENARCLLQSAKLLYLDATADNKRFFQTRANPGHYQTDSEEILKRFFTKEFAYRLLDVFKDDYALFRLERPAWVDGATGEWFDMDASEVKDQKRLGGEADPGGAEEDEDEDDLVVLAERAGFSLSWGRAQGSASQA